jgi:DNA polymerase III subunit epsilon
MRLDTLPVLAIDCQASGASPTYGEVLEIGWSLVSDEPAGAHAFWTKIERAVPHPIRKLTGWEPSFLEHAIDPIEAWRAMLSTEAPIAPRPTVIHWAQFELPFLRDLHLRDGGEEPFPIDVVCLHRAAARLFPGLPRRNIRALAGHLGHSAEMLRRARGHVEATAFVWRAILPKLEAHGVTTWDELKTWLAEAPSARSPRPGARAFPLAREKRKALPDAPGVYRFVRPNGDVLYVGKAASLKKRVASHYTLAAGARAADRALEMLSQAHDVLVTATETCLEAALLEADEIKRIDPPYNVQLRAGDRSAWFASRSWDDVSDVPDERYVVGPLPSRRAIAGVAAMRALCEGRGASHAAVLGVPSAFAPDRALFEEVWRTFVRDHALGGDVRRRLLDAAARIDPKSLESDDESDAWDAPRVRRHLDRTLATEGGLIRRARALRLLTHAHVAFREIKQERIRHLVIADGRIAERSTRDSFEPAEAPMRPPSRGIRARTFDAAAYDRLRVLWTELRRVADEGGAVVVRVGAHVLRASVSTPRPARGS